MTLQTPYPHIEESQGQPARLRRHPRIRVAQIVMDYLAHGWSAEEICRQHPNLSPAEVHAAMAYYFDHQSAIDAEVADESAQVGGEVGSTSTSPFFLRMRSPGVFKCLSTSTWTFTFHRLSPINPAS
jgi:uncharacterized protein (DUF433 family)